MNGTATAGTDYTELAANVVFAAGARGADLRQTVSITVADDDLTEHSETFTVAFGTLPPGVTAGTPAAVTVTLLDGTIPAVSFTAETVTVAENAGVLPVTLALDASPAVNVTVRYRVRGDTARFARDYITLGGSVTFRAGATGSALQQTRNIVIIDDDAYEPEERFFVDIVPALPASITAGAISRVVVTIADNDAALTVSFTQNIIHVDENTPAVEAVMQLSRTSTANLTVYARTRGTVALPDIDYRSLPPTPFTFPAGTTGTDRARRDHR